MTLYTVTMTFGRALRYGLQPETATTTGQTADQVLAYVARALDHNARFLADPVTVTITPER